MVYNILMEKITLILKKIKQETEDVKTLVFVLENNKKLDFKAGQYLNLFFSDDKDGHGKPYTISSAPYDDIHITVKNMGSFSGKLHKMKLGEKIEAVGPLGFMILSEMEDLDGDIVFIAGGIGVTPFYSMIKDIFQNGKKNNISFFYANQKKESIIFYDELEKINKENNNFNFYHFLSRDKKFKAQNVKNRRLEMEDLMDTLGDVKSKIFFICGSIKFVNDFWKDLKENGAKEDNIFTEAFFVG